VIAPPDPGRVGVFVKHVGPAVGAIADVTGQIADGVSHRAWHLCMLARGLVLGMTSRVQPEADDPAVGPTSDTRNPANAYRQAFLSLRKVIS